MKDQEFNEALQKAKVPVLVLDQKWHRLFAINGKPKEVKEEEQIVNGLLARQGEINQNLKEYKKAKVSLMQNIVENMEGAESSNADAETSQKLEEDRRLMDELNQKIQECEDELMDMPKQIHEHNLKLMIVTMQFSYHKLRTNTTEAEEISSWIKQMRIDLKKNIIRKQNREINNKEIYSYMHDIFGKDVIDLFDVRNDDFVLGRIEEDDKVEETKQSDNKESDNKEPEGQA